MAINKVVLNDVVKLDLTADTVTADKLKQGETAHDAAGNPITGTMTVTTPTLTVKTNAGASVTATKGDYTVSGTADSSGSCVLGLPEFGEWTVTASLSGNTATVIANVLASYNEKAYTVISASISGNLNSSSGYVKINGTTYSSETVVSVYAGQSVTVYVSGGSAAKTDCEILFNRTIVQTGEGEYVFTPDEDVSISFARVKVPNTTGYVWKAEITTASYDTSAAVASILLGEEIV